MSQRFLLQSVICAQSAVDLDIWADFGRFEWFCKRKGNYMTEIRVYIFGKGFPQATASLVTCYNAVGGSYPPKRNNKLRKLDWHSTDVRRPSICVQPSNNVRMSNGGQPWPAYIHICPKSLIDICTYCQYMREGKPAESTYQLVYRSRALQ